LKTLTKATDVEKLHRLCINLAMTLSDQILGWGTAAGLVTGLVVGIVKYRRIGVPTGAADAFLNNPELKNARAESEAAMQNLRVKGLLKSSPKA